MGTQGARTISLKWLLHRSLTPELSMLGEDRSFHPPGRLRETFIFNAGREAFLGKSPLPAPVQEKEPGR